jgi:hypothetical protein
LLKDLSTVSTVLQIDLIHHFWPPYGRPSNLWATIATQEGDLNEGVGTERTKIERATKKLHDAMDALGPPTNITYVGSEKIRWGGYNKVLSAVRELAIAGGNPFDDEHFKRFFNLLVEPRSVFRFTETSPENVLEQQKFMKTVLRICGGEIKPNGTISLIRRSLKRRERN